MALPNTFANLTVAQMAALDQNFTALGNFIVLPCSVSGTNALALTLLTDTPTIAAYSNYLIFSGVAAGTNTGAATAAVGSLPSLAIFRDGPGAPTALIGGEIVAGAFVLLAYDGALPGFHLLNPSIAYPLAPIITINNNAGVSMTAAQVTGSGIGRTVIARTGAPGGGFNDATPTAAQIVAALPGAVIGTTFWMRVLNSTGQTQTLVAGTNVTISGTATTPNGTSHEFQGVVSTISGPNVVFYG